MISPQFCQGSTSSPQVDGGAGSATSSSAGDSDAAVFADQSAAAFSNSPALGSYFRPCRNPLRIR